METQGFELKLIDTRRVTLTQDTPHAQKRREDAESGRRKALQFAEEALLTAATIMRTSHDEKLKLNACKMIMDRAWGTPKTMEEADETARNQSIIELLASMHTTIDVPRVTAQNAEAPALADPRVLDGLLVRDPE